MDGGQGREMSGDFSHARVQERGYFFCTVFSLQFYDVLCLWGSSYTYIERASLCIIVYIQSFGHGSSLISPFAQASQDGSTSEVGCQGFHGWA